MGSSWPGSWPELHAQKGHEKGLCTAQRANVAGQWQSPQKDTTTRVLAPKDQAQRQRRGRRNPPVRGGLDRDRGRGVRRLLGATGEEVEDGSVLNDAHGAHGGTEAARERETHSRGLPSQARSKGRNRPSPRQRQPRRGPVGARRQGGAAAVGLKPEEGV